MNLKDISTADKDTRAIIGAIAQMIINDISDNADLRVELAERVGYDKGLDIGYKKGYLAAQRNIRNAMFAVQFEAGIIKLPEID